MTGRTEFSSKEPLVWVGEDELRAGWTAALDAVPGTGDADAGEISGTAAEILASMGYIPWIDMNGASE